MLTRRQVLSSAAAIILPRTAFASTAKPMRGVFVIMATPFTTTKAIDYEDLEHEVGFLHQCGAHGMVWPQLASEYWLLSKEERMRGMSVLARAAKGKKPALVLGVQGPDKATMLEYAEHAESLAPDAIISMPPGEAKSLDEIRGAYRALARVTSRPIFMQTTGGPKGLIPPVEMIVGLAREFPNFGYVKEEAAPVIDRLLEMQTFRPAMKALFSGAGGRGMLYEARLGFDGTMPGAIYADIHSQVFDLWHAGRPEEARDLFAKLLLVQEIEQQIDGVRPYILKRRGVAKTTVSRRKDVQLNAAQIKEIEFDLETLKAHFRVTLA